MKLPPLLAPVLLASTLSAPAASIGIEDICPHFPTNAAILWAAPAVHLPKKLPTYVAVARRFSAAAISNAMVLASFNPKGHPHAPLTGLHLQDPEDDYWFRSLDISPVLGQIMYDVRGSPLKPHGVPAFEEVSRRAWQYAPLLGVSRSELLERAENRKEILCDWGPTNEVCLRRVFLTRKFKGFEFRDYGFDITFGGEAQLRGFALVWPNLKRARAYPVVPPEQIVQCIRAGRTLLASTNDGIVDFDVAKVKVLADATRVTIEKITPFYAVGPFGPPVREQEQPRDLTPQAELECSVALGQTNLNVRLLVPLISRDISLPHH